MDKYVLKNIIPKNIIEKANEKLKFSQNFKSKKTYQIIFIFKKVMMQKMFIFQIY